MKYIIVVIMASLFLTSPLWAGEKEDLTAKLQILQDRATGIDAVIKAKTPDEQARLKAVQDEAGPIVTRLNAIAAEEKKAAEVKKP